MVRKVDEKLLEEQKKYAHILIWPGFYCAKDNSNIKYEILSIKDLVEIKTLKSGAIRKKTIFWCQKHLIRLENEGNEK